MPGKMTGVAPDPDNQMLVLVRIANIPSNSPKKENHIQS